MSVIIAASLGFTAGGCGNPNVEPTPTSTPLPTPTPGVIYETRILLGLGIQRDMLGCAVSVDGDVAVVGAEGNSPGAAYVFSRNRGGPDNWGLVANLTGAGLHTTDHFGQSVSVAGDVIIVGATDSAYVFHRNYGGPDNWGRVARLEYLVSSVAVSGDLLAVGSPGGRSGRTYVHKRSQGGANNWGQVAAIGPPDILTDYKFGSSVSMSGNLLAVGDPAPGQPGLAYVFDRRWDGPDSGDRVTVLMMDDAGDGFGYSVALSGDTAAVGDPWQPDYAGSVYVFDRDNDRTWSTVAKLLPPAPDIYTTPRRYFGGSVSLCEDALVVGEKPYQDSAGAAHLFRRDKGGRNNWGWVTRLAPSDGTLPGHRYDYFGYSVSVSRDVAIVGAPYRGGQAGGVYVFSGLVQ